MKIYGKEKERRFWIGKSPDYRGRTGIIEKIRRSKKREGGNPQRHKREVTVTTWE